MIVLSRRAHVTSRHPEAFMMLSRVDGALNDSASARSFTVALDPDIAIQLNTRGAATDLDCALRLNAGDDWHFFRARPR